MKKHRLAFAVLAVAALVAAASDYAEFLGPYAPWLSVGSLISIPVGAWFGLLSAEAVKG